ncbi:DUF1837 domain-containing protein [Listeria booriae]|uniref:Hachiman antiphage defense system protein HamA n=1 Tax=Listeria booriae TaxID=1552123 RepID=UPI001629B118|nr:Hachiman antiphage defense system protein HamA [Listeria booriae]MBC2047182.1 DUF1837 domain-containing protein [Listeria booriae]MBC2259291.1 DUF1837 domain-containing protein [Listeria booriae]MBC6128935.1 DUF1837 domain-containing protein [Listeria booriae]
MMILVHYTTREFVYNLFKNSREITYQTQLEEVRNFYDSYHRTQENLFFIISYTNNLKIEYNVGKIAFIDNKFIFNKVAGELSDILIEDLGITDTNTYEKDFYYKMLWIEEKLEFRNKNLDRYSSKIRLKYFDWEELLLKNEILFKKISDIIFDKGNVIKLASAYNPDLSYDDIAITKKYFSALKNLGFVNKEGINIKHTVLHGDIGEFLMHTLVSEFIESIGDKYIYPKLIFKTNPAMAVYGNDGSIYIPEKKEIYYLEAKFYSGLNEAINKAVESLKKHNDDLHEDMNYSAELFRNIKTNRTNELVEIADDVEEKLIIFLICDDIYSEEEIRNTIENNSNFFELKEQFETLIFVLPILSKNEFLKFFQVKSMHEGKEYYEQQ